MFSTKGEQEVSWFESLPETSLALLKACGLSKETCVVDVGGGDSHLIDHLVKPGGWAIVATFAPDGPEKCSGLPVRRYSPEMLETELGPEFERVETRTHTHQTPWGATQSFQYSRFRRHRAG